MVKKSGALLPTYIGLAVTHLLRTHFAKYVDLKFTARMEDDLDQIAAGKVDWVEFLENFYRGGGGEAGLVQDIEEQLDNIAFPRIPLGEDPETGKPIVLRIGTQLRLRGGRWRGRIGGRPCPWTCSSTN